MTVVTLVTVVAKKNLNLFPKKNPNKILKTINIFAIIIFQQSTFFTFHVSSQHIYEKKKKPEIVKEKKFKT